MNERHAKARKIFQQVVEIESSEQREAALLDSCESDADLLAEVRNLLAANDAARGWLGNSNDAEAVTSPPIAASSDFGDPNEHPTDDRKMDKTIARGTYIGPYKLLQQIGEGGMGTVWMAEQEQPVRRRVAVKIIRGDMGDRDTIARFEAERQALAMMDHQNIARVFDAGTTESGSPWFAMELVKGIPITQYCDDNQLGIRERLELMIPVCEAIQHAHHKGIVHRDLKPSNVLVTLYDGRAVPKVIDFGLAKALEHQVRLTDKTLFTEFGKVVGTLQYMSPEQAEMNALDVDTRTDVYSLGVLLYELLTGSTPIDKTTLREKAILQVLALIRETEPPRPSTRLSQSAETIEGISKQRKIAAPKLQEILRGELDWIVMRALEKDRTRRYETANGLAMDIERYLQGDVVDARPPSTSYRISKFVRKNQGFAASLATIGFLLITATIVSTWFNVAANRARRVAELQETRANTERDNAEIAKKELEAKSVLLADQARHLEQQAYVFGISKARTLLKSGELDHARKILDSLPESLRGWEWGYLVAESDCSLNRTSLPSNVRVRCKSPRGRFALLESAKEKGQIGQFELFDVNAGETVARIAIDDQIESVLSTAMSYDGQRVAILAVNSSKKVLASTLYIWEKTKAGFVWKKRTSSDTDTLLLVKRAFMSHDGERIFISTERSSRAKAAAQKVIGSQSQSQSQSQTEARYTFNTADGLLLVCRNRGVDGFQAFHLGNLISFDDSNEDGTLLWDKFGSKTIRLDEDRTAIILDHETNSGSNSTRNSRTYYDVVGTSGMMARKKNGEWALFDIRQNDIVGKVGRVPQELRHLTFYSGGECYVSVVKNELLATVSGTQISSRIGPIRADTDELFVDEPLGKVYAYAGNHVFHYPLPTRYEVEQINQLVNDDWMDGKNSLIGNKARWIQAGRIGRADQVRNVETGKIVAFKVWRRWIPHIVQDQLLECHSHVLRIFDTLHYKTKGRFELEKVFVEYSAYSIVANRGGSTAALIAKSEQRTLANFNQYYCFVFDLPSGKFRSSMEIVFPSQLLFMDGNLLYLFEDGHLVSRDVSSGLAIVERFPMEATAMGLSPDYNMLAAVDNRFLKIYSFPEMELQTTVELNHGNNTQVKWGFDERSVFVSNGRLATLCRIDLQSPVLTFDNPSSMHLPTNGTTGIIGENLVSSIPLKERWPVLRKTFAEETAEKTFRVARNVLLNEINESTDISSVDSKILNSDSLTNPQKRAALSELATVTEQLEKLEESGNFGGTVRRNEFVKWMKETENEHLLPVFNALDEKWIPAPDSSNVNQVLWDAVCEVPQHSELSKIADLVERLVSKIDETNDGAELNTLGVAYYRVDEHLKAIDTLLKSLPLNQQDNLLPEPADSAFLAMSYLKLGDVEQAEKYRVLFEQAMKLEANRTEETLGFAKEVEQAFAERGD